MDHNQLTGGNTCVTWDADNAWQSRAQSQLVVEVRKDLVVPKRLRELDVLARIRQHVDALGAVQRLQANPVLGFQGNMEAINAGAVIETLIQTVSFVAQVQPVRSRHTHSQSRNLSHRTLSEHHIASHHIT